MNPVHTIRLDRTPSEFNSRISRFRSLDPSEKEDDCDLILLSVADRELDIDGGRLCLLYPDGAADLRILQDGFVDDHMMDHSHTVAWDPGIGVL